MESDRQNAFVVWIDPSDGASGRATRYRGRVEHVRTSTRATVSSREELLAFIERHSLDGDPPKATDDGPAGATS